VTWWQWALLLGVGALVLHRAMLAMERRGWVYYRGQRRGAMGAAAMFALDEVVQPSRQEIVIEQAEQEIRGARREVPGDQPATPE
jgi:uncharacterized membrane protein